MTGARRSGQSVTVPIVLGALLQESEKDDIGRVILVALLILAVVGIVACMMMLLPILIAFRHGLRWTVATVAASWLAGVPLRMAFDPNELPLESRGLLSFPLWIVIAIVAWRGPPEWFPTRSPRPGSALSSKRG